MLRDMIAFNIDIIPDVHVRTPEQVGTSRAEIKRAQAYFVRIECLECSPPQAREMSITAEPEETVRRVVSFTP